MKVFTNLSAAVLHLPDGTSRTGENNGNGGIVFPNVPLQDGGNTFTVTAALDGQTFSDTVTFTKVSEPEPSYILPNSGAGQMVKNWFLDEDIDTDAYYSLQDTAQEIMDFPEAYAVLKQHVPDLCRVLERGVIPLGLSMKSILSRETPEGLDLQALNGDLMRIVK